MIKEQLDNSVELYAEPTGNKGLYRACIRSNGTVSYRSQLSFERASTAQMHAALVFVGINEPERE